MPWSAEGSRPERWLLFLHGLLGRGGNWRAIARRLVAARPGWGAALVDLRMHGATQGFPPPHTVAATAEDLLALDGALPGPVRAVLGHSFGGKVALAYLVRRGDALDRAVIVDAMPGARPGREGPGTTLDVLGWLGALGVIPSRADFIARAREAGYGHALAEWLAMNFRRTEAGYELALDLGAIRALLDDYFACDLWPVVERPPGALALHLVIGEHSPVWGAGDRARGDRIAAGSNGRVIVHRLPTSHWVHAEDPDLLLGVLTGALA